MDKEKKQNPRGGASAGVLLTSHHNAKERKNENHFKKGVLSAFEEDPGPEGHRSTFQ